MKRRITLIVLLCATLGGCKSMYQKCMDAGYPDAYCRGLHDGWASGWGRLQKNLDGTDLYDEGWEDGMRTGAAAAQRNSTWAASHWNHH